ncbi:DUF2924 domain-containing protein, partial [Nereida sp. MMG025]|uniref:DUF2924 domain-containing protein n=1 Tax=Nereida sp. MMG025 TaxID=2909981 RepID=UPI001F37EBB8
RFGAPPCKHLSVAFMQRVLLWEAQGSVFGLVPKSTKRKIAAAANGKATSKASKTQPGDVLVREWNGRTYRVEVTTSGYVMDGKPWRSLTALVKHITGAHWSGPRFFGVA